MPRLRFTRYLELIPMDIPPPPLTHFFATTG